MLKMVETSSVLTLTAIEENKFQAGVVTLDMVSNGVGYAKTNKELSKDVISQVEEAKKAIIDGKIKVIPTYKEALAAGIAPAGLGAIDD